jgi:uncharacterized protein (DUF58 family)
MLAAAVAVLLLLGHAADYPELVAVGLAGATVLAIAAAWLLVRPNIAATRTIDPPRVTEGSPATATLTVTNRSRRRTPAILVDEDVAGQPVTIALPAIPGRGRHEVAYPLPTSRRGRYAIAPVTIAAADPLRLFRVSHRYGRASVLYVHPRVHPVVARTARGPRDVDGAATAYWPRGGVAFHSLRPYAPGDDCRLLHWKATARSGAPMVRHNVVPDHARHLVVLDTSAASYRGESFEDAVRTAASACVALTSAGCALSLRTTGGLAAAGRRVADVLDALAGVRCAPGDPGLAALRHLAPEGEHVHLLVVTGRPGPAQLAVLPRIRARFRDVRMLRVGPDPAPPGSSVTGIRSVSLRTSEELPAAWDHLARR